MSLAERLLNASNLGFVSLSFDGFNGIENALVVLNRLFLCIKFPRCVGGIDG